VCAPGDEPAVGQCLVRRLRRGLAQQLTQPAPRRDQPDSGGRVVRQRDVAALRRLEQIDALGPLVLAAPAQQVGPAEHYGGADGQLRHPRSEIAVQGQAAEVLVELHGERLGQQQREDRAE
jgi:hypothetical protein